MNISAISNELMVAVSYTACEYQYGRGDVTELTVVSGTQNVGHCALSLVYCHSPKLRMN
jgi:hypothetical protein